MIDDELLAKFDRIQDLPVSEEMLGAYLERTLNGSELSELQSIISADYDLASFVSTIESDSQNFDEIYNGDLIDFSGDSVFIDEFENFEDMKDLAKAYNTFGEHGENILDPVYVQQPDDHSCALRSQQIVLRDYGIDIPFQQLEKLALDNGVYTEHGTYTYDIGKVLQIAGVGMHQVQGSSLYDLTNELAQGHRVIVSVDANELWYTDSMNKLKNWFNDAIGNQGGNHALIVAGVEVNPNDFNDVKVVLTDPGAGHLRVEYPLDQFMDAWKDSKCFMAATNDPAPYQYDATTGMEVPSNFAVQQHINDFVANNSYQLSPDMINVPQGYQPAFVGHLDVVGDVDYDAFKADYAAMVEKRIPSILSVKEQIEEVAKLHEEQEIHNGNELNTAFHSSYESIGTQSNESGEPNQSLFKSECHNVDNEETDGDDSNRSIITDNDDDSSEEDDDDPSEEDDDDYDEE